MKGKIRNYKSNQKGQSLVEFAITLPLLLCLVLGIIDLSWALYDQHILVKLSREGANLISRDTTLQDAGTALSAMSQAPVNMNSSTSKVLLSVIRMGAAGSANAGFPVLAQRYEVGTLASVNSRLVSSAVYPGDFLGAPNYEAGRASAPSATADSDSRYRITTLPNGIVMGTGTIYVVEVYSVHPTLTPVTGFLQYVGFNLPNRLYSIACF